MPRLRLLHFIVQPVLVWDDGDEMLPATHPDGTPLIATGSFTLPALRRAADTFEADLAAIENQLTAGRPATLDDGPADNPEPVTPA